MSRRSEIIRCKWRDDDSIRFFRMDEKKGGGVPELVMDSAKKPSSTIVTAHVNHVVIEL